MSKYKLLVVEDDQLSMLAFLAMISEGWKEFECLAAKSLSEASKIIETQKIDICFIDMDLDNQFEGLKIIKLLPESVYKVVLTSHDDQETIFKSYTQGCNDFIKKPMKRSILAKIISKFLLIYKENIDDYLQQTFLTQDQEYLKQLRLINKWALNDSPLMILGETGSGKTHIAREIHARGKKTDSQIVHLNCAEIPEALFEGELFGYKKGAFTGASQNKQGKLEMAHNGTLFLDEIGAMPLNIQQKFLRVLEEKTFYPLGSEISVSSNFRIICATCDNLEELVQNKKFRSDLFFRLKGEEIVIPSLRSRKEDITLIVDNFVSKSYRKIVFAKNLVEKFQNYSWPGNVRELLLVLNNLGSSDKGILEAQDWQINEVQTNLVTSNSFDSLKNEVFEKGLSQVIQELESQIVMEIFKESKFKVRETMRKIKISNATFYKILGRSKV